MKQLIIQYVKANWLIVIIAVYILISSVLKAVTGINFTIPCLFRVIFDFHCPGCGLTTAFICLLKLDFGGAWYYNPLIFGVMPFGIYYCIRDFISFKKRRIKITS